MNNHEKQLLLKGIKSGFSFQFSVDKNDLYINSLSQEISYGWETPSEEGKSIFAKPITQVAFNSSKTTHDITLNGFVYINTEIGCGLDNFTKFKEICNKGETWYLIDNKGNKLKGGGKGIWYVKGISINSSDFITGINALKISFSITINKYS
jgi:phage protein U